MKTIKSFAMTVTLICAFALAAAAQDPGTITIGSDKTQPPVPPPPSTGTASTGTASTDPGDAPEEDESLLDDLIDWLGLGDDDGQ